MLLIFQIAYFIIGVTAASAPVRGMNLDDTTATTTVSGGVSPDDEIKCGGCPCNNPCYIASPPPPPPPPPPPSLPPPKMPSPTSGLNCPPPPTGGGYVLGPPAYIYITGPPENLYPVNPYFSGAHRNFWAAPLLLMFGILGVIIIS